MFEAALHNHLRVPPCILSVAKQYKAKPVEGKKAFGFPVRDINLCPSKEPKGAAASLLFFLE